MQLILMHFLDKAFGQKQAQSIVDLYKKEQGETVREKLKKTRLEEKRLRMRLLFSLSIV